MECIINNIGKNIRAARIEKGLSQQALAEKCGISNTTLSSYENEKKTPSLYTIGAIAKGLGVSIERLCYGDENNSFINSVPDDGRKIVNSVYLLWEKRVITWNDSVQGVLENGRLYRAEATGTDVSLSAHLIPILRLLKSLNEFSKKRSTFEDPEKYLDMLLSSVATEINQEIEEEKRKDEQKKNIRKAID